MEYMGFEDEIWFDFGSSNDDCEIFQERVKMISAGNYEQNRLVAVVGTLHGRPVSQPA